MDGILRRRDMMKIVGTSPTPTGYVTDGLIAYWDGIDNTGGHGHDANAMAWTDLVHGYPMARADGNAPVWSAYGLDVNGYATGVSSSPLWSASADGTIEVVLIPDDASTRTVCAFDRSSRNSARLIYLCSDQTVGAEAAANTTTYSSPILITNIRKITALYTNYTSSNVYINGSEVSRSTKTHTMAQHGDTFDIGRRNQNDYAFKGLIMAVRVYNKKLSASEIAQNDAYDNDRFSLNLIL